MRFTVDETIEMLLGEGLQKIEEDSEFPFPHEFDGESDNSSGSSLSEGNIQT